MRKLITALGVAATLATPAVASPSLTDVYGPAQVPPGCRSSGYCPVRPFAWIPPAPPIYVPPPVVYAPFVAPPPLPLGWVYGPYTYASNGTVWVSVGADGLNVRTGPNGPVALALANGTPIVPTGARQGNWILVAPACALAPTYTFSVTAAVPLSVCVA